MYSYDERIRAVKLYLDQLSDLLLILLRRRFSVGHCLSRLSGTTSVTLHVELKDGRVVRKWLR